MDTILLLEDEQGAGQVLKDFLELKGYYVFWALNGREAFEILQREASNISMAVLDIMVPDIDGYELLRRIRTNPFTEHTPVIFLTARNREEDEIHGLSLGADDYIRKPASLNLIHAHIQMLLRRFCPPNRCLHFGELCYNKETQEVRIGGDAVGLTHTELNLLRIFLESPNRVFSRQEILDNLNEVEEKKIVYDRTVDAHIKNLRLKLGDQSSLIKTYRGVGYGVNREYIMA